MQKVLAALLLTLLGISSACADEWDRYFHLGVGLMNDDFMALPDNSDAEHSFVPMVSVGVNFERALDQDWSLSHGVSLSYASTEAALLDFQPMPLTTRVENTGIWLNSTLRYHALFDSARPFITLSVGKVYAEYDVPEQSISGWATGYRAMTGLEFDLSNESSLSIGFGVGDTGDID